MRKLALFSVSVSALTLCTGMANAADLEVPHSPADWYISMFGGAVIPENSGFIYNSYTYDVGNRTGFTVGGAVGTQLAPGVRGELEASYMRYTARDYTYYSGQEPGEASGEQNLFFFTANVWKDFNGFGLFMPYLGGGIGVGIADVAVDHYTQDGANSKDTSIGLAGQIGAGVKVPMSDRLSFEIGYRFKGLVGTDARGDQGNDSDHSRVNYYNHSILGGLTYQIGASSYASSVADYGSSNASYLSIFGGVVVPENTGYVNYGYVYDVRSKTGFTVGAAIGTKLSPGLRGELEFSYANYAAKDYNYDPSDRAPASGEAHTLMALANIWKDIPLGHLGLYIGGGLGLGLVEATIAHYDNDTDQQGVEDQRIGLAGQFGAGVRTPMTDRLTLDAGYRFKGVVGVTMDGYSSGANEGANERASFYQHVLQLGATYAMGDGYVLPASYRKEPSETYVSVFGGVVQPENAAITYDSYVYDTQFKTGFTVGAAVGTQIMETVRGELEISYMKYAAKDYTYEGDDAADPAFGDQNLVFVMANAWKDFNFGMLSPYVGGGIGVGISNIDISFRGTEYRINDTAIALAGQLGAGFRYDMTENLKLDVGYRFKGIMDATIYGAPNTDNYHAQGNFFSHVGQVGLTLDMN